MQPINFDAVLDRIVKQDPRYDREAYLFLREALDHTQRNLEKSRKDEARHVSGQQLLDGIRHYALDRFGPMTLTVFEAWGITRCEDFGEIVFNMVDHQLLGKTQEDSRADFAGGYAFQPAFLDPFLPPSKRAPSSMVADAQPKPGSESR